MSHSDIRIVREIETADLVIRFKEIKDAHYSRKDNDLFYIHRLSLLEAINAESFNVVSRRAKR